MKERGGERSPKLEGRESIDPGGNKPKTGGDRRHRRRRWRPGGISVTSFFVFRLICGLVSGRLLDVY